MSASVVTSARGLRSYERQFGAENAVMREVEQVENTLEFVALLPPSVRRALLEVPLD